MDRMSFLSIGSNYNCHNNSASFIKVEIKIFVFLRIVLFSRTQLIRRKFRRRQGKVFAEFLNLIVTTLGWAGMSFIELAVGRVHSEKQKVLTRKRCSFYFLFVQIHKACRTRPKGLQMRYLMP